MEASDFIEASVPRKGPIAVEVLGCLEALGVVRKKLLEHYHDTTVTISKAQDQEQLEEALEDYHGRFRVWAGNIGAHKAGKISLDHRLEDSSHIGSRVVRLLKDLNKLLAEVRAILDGECQPAELAKYNSDSSDAESTSDEEGSQSEVEQICLEILDVIKCLYRISTNVRSPGGNRRYGKAASIDISHFGPFDIDFVRSKFPKAKEYLVIRLGKATTRRRQFFKYQELHSTKLARNLDANDNRTMPSETTATELTRKEQETLDRVDSESLGAESETSYATTAGDSTEAKWPPIPSEGIEGGTI